jgi:hypothetical protein
VFSASVVEASAAAPVPDTGLLEMELMTSLPR